MSKVKPIENWDFEEDHYIFRLYPKEMKDLWYELALRYVSEEKQYVSAYVCTTYTNAKNKKVFSRRYLGNGSIEKCVHLINKDSKTLEE